jgi:hypothetical protein
MTGDIAHVGPNIPLALLQATRRHAGSLKFDPDAPTPAAERWLERKFAPWAKSILEAWAGGAYDALGQVVFSRADDSAQRLYYYVCELQRRRLIGGPEALILDIAKVPRETSVARTERCLRELAEELGVDETALGSATDRRDRECVEEAVSSEQPRCLLTGTPPPDRRLHDAIAQAGFVPVGRTLHDSWNDPGRPLDLARVGPFATLAREVHAADGPRSFADPGRTLGDAVAAAGATAVILWQIEEDEAEAWHLPAQRRALAQAGVANLVMTRRDWLGRDGAAAEIAAFLGTLAR